MQLSKLILGIDAGNYRAKTAGFYGVDSYKTNICNWFERNVKEQFGDDDMEFEIDGRKGYSGTIAQFEDEFGDGTIYGETKAHDDTKIRILLAIYRYLEKFKLDVESVYLVTGQPIRMHNDDEKQKIMKMLIRKHDFVVNDKRITFKIEGVGIAPEGSAAFWSNPELGTKRIIDIGSGTVNLATIIDKKHIHKSSDTMNTGIETLRNKYDYEALAHAVFRTATRLKWQSGETIQVCGGVSEVILPYIRKYFPFAVAMVPKLKRQYDTLSVSPTYANAVGCYTIARGVFK